MADLSIRDSILKREKENEEGLSPVMGEETRSLLATGMRHIKARNLLVFPTP